MSNAQARGTTRSRIRCQRFSDQRIGAWTFAGRVVAGYANQPCPWTRGAIGATGKVAPPDAQGEGRLQGGVAGHPIHERRTADAGNRTQSSGSGLQKC